MQYNAMALTCIAQKCIDPSPVTWGVFAVHEVQNQKHMAVVHQPYHALALKMTILC